MKKNMTATLKYATISPIKLELIAKLVRGKSIDDALNMLQFMQKKWADILHKVVKNANNNAKQSGVSAPLKILRVDVSRWPKLKRMRFVGRARIHRYEKPRAFVRVVVGE